LEGFDENWREVGNKRSALYTNLDSGTYIFRVKASNNDGIWNEEGKSITLVQLPPPWKTWWAYTIYVFTLITITIQFVQSQRKKRRLVEEQNRLLEIKVAERTGELREKNDDIQAMLSNMRQGLFTLEVGGSIHPEYSHFLQEIFETTAITGTKGMHLLFGQSHLGRDRVNQIQQALNTILGEAEINYSFNAHLLIREYEATINGHHKFLSLDWNPIVVSHVVSKVMVSVRDVTLLKQMERDAQAKKRELDIISQLLNVPRKKYVSFVLSCQRFVEENRAQIDKHTARSDASIALLFRNMHTVKGNCRTIGFSHFSDVVHDVESYYSQLKKDPECEWNHQQLLHDLTRVEAILAEYQHIYGDVLGRGDSNSLRDQKGFWADGKAIETIQQCLDAMHKKFPSPKDTKEWQPIQGLLNAALSTPLDEVLADIVESLPSIAVQLHKESPDVNIADNNIRIKSDSCELITHIFSHILHNCVDHGIEVPDVRVRVGKPRRGTIDIIAEVVNDMLLIRVKDDGQGVNIDSLFKKGVEIGQWKNTDKPSYQTIADLMFASGVSTKEQVTDISGRGVGMDAVKQFLVEKNGNIELRLVQAGAHHEVIGVGIKVPFELVIELPSDSFTRGG
jgi:HPt (histidine-containing phosphotransfer) domain-containing protein